MEPLTVLFGILFGVGYDQWKERRAAKQKAAEADKHDAPMVFLPAEVELFTHAVAGARTFDNDCARVMREDLKLRSAIPQHLPPEQAAIGSAFRVVPLRSDMPLASAVLEQAQASGATVIGSLSLAVLLSGIEAPYVLMVGGDELASLAPMRPLRGLPAAFAVIPPPPPEPVVEAESEAAEASSSSSSPPEPAPSPFPAPPVVLNGAAKGPPVVLGNVMHPPAKGEGA
jgi:hypothetical protein